MSLESTYFKKSYRYRSKLINRWIAIVRYSNNDKRINSYKNLIFKMMKDVVKKNIANYMNLLRNTDVKCIPCRDELIAECYIVFDKCVQKYVLNSTFNFYFYFNKSLSRNFFRCYQKELKRSNSSVEISEALESVNKSFHCFTDPNSVELLMDNLRFNDVEKRICRSKIAGQKISDFLAENKDVTNSVYCAAMKRIKEILLKDVELWK